MHKWTADATDVADDNDELRVEGNQRIDEGVQVVGLCFWFMLDGEIIIFFWDEFVDRKFNRGIFLK